MGKGRKRKQPALVDYLMPTPERIAHGEVITAGMARKIVPAIETLHKRGLIDAKEYDALAYYRDQASLAEHSPVRSCCDTSPRGGSDHGPGVAILSAMLETGRIERDLGQLVDIARAVAVDDKSLSQWCIDKHGGRERYDGNGRFVAIVPICEKRHMEIARLELRMAARRIVR